MRNVMLVIGGLCMFGCGSRKPVEVYVTNEITVTDGKNSEPEFRRVYTTTLDNRAVLKVEIRSFLGRRDDSTLTQPDGRWVIFDMDRIADRILDPTLVPKVAAACKEIKRLDDAYMATGPMEYRDEHGIVWKRQGDVR